MIQGDFQAPNWLDLQRLHHNLLNMGTSFIRTPGLDGAQRRSARKPLPGTQPVFW
jgi:hypothetical protein